MHERALQDVRRKFVEFMKADPLPLHEHAHDRPARARRFDRWVAARFSPEEIDVIIRLERQYGEQALNEWVTEIALEAKRAGRTTH